MRLRRVVPKVGNICVRLAKSWTDGVLIDDLDANPIAIAPPT